MVQSVPQVLIRITCCLFVINSVALYSRIIGSFVSHWFNSYSCVDMSESYGYEQIDRASPT